jgi:cobalt/nickel transport system permease protein
MTLLLEIPDVQPSLLHRLDPRWKLAALLVAMAAVAPLQTLPAALAALGGAVALVLLARLPWRWALARIAVALVLPVLLVLWLPLTTHADETWNVGRVPISAIGLAQALTLLARAASIVTTALVLVTTAPLHDTFKAAQSLRVPGWLVQLALLSYRYVFVLAEEFVRLRTALRVRGYRNRARWHSYRTIGQVAGTLLVRGHDRSERVAQAMRCRGFDGRFRSLHDFHTRAADVLFCAAVILAAGGILAWDVVVGRS